MNKLDISIFFDGACSNNGNKLMGIGVLATIHKEGKFLDELCTIKNYGVGTSNEAEWMACCEAMRLIKRIEDKHGSQYNIQIFSDSQIISNQFNGKYNINSKNLQKFYDKAIQLKEQTNFKGYIKWIKRDFNYPADRLSKLGLCCPFEYFNFN